MKNSKPPKTRKSEPLEKIVWHDISKISSEETGWYSLDRMVDLAKELYDLEYITVGYIIYENKDFVVVAGTSNGRRPDSEYEPTWHDGSMIMKSVIIRREPLLPSKSKTRPKK